MGSASGALKTAANRIGVSVEEYQTRRAQGLKWCTPCQEWRPTEQFVVDRSRGDGLASKCKIHGARTRPGPGKPARQEAAQRGKRWCRGCEAWLDLPDVSRLGLCRPCAAAASRAYYAGPARDVIQARVNARRRNLAPIPPWWRVERTADFGGQCAYGCGSPAVALDHIWPVRKGGRSVPGNLVPACTSCNSRKKDTDPAPWVERGTGAFPEEWLSVAALAINHNTDEWLEATHV